MMKSVLAAAVLLSAAAPALAAAPPAEKPMAATKHHGTMIKPAREPSTDKLNQQQLDAIKS